jgi:hypothetical protein
MEKEGLRLFIYYLLGSFSHKGKAGFILIILKGIYCVFIFPMILIGSSKYDSAEEVHRAGIAKRILIHFSFSVFSLFIWALIINSIAKLII